MSFLDFGSGQRAGGMGGYSPIALGVLGLLAYRTLKGKGHLADMFGTDTSASGGATPQSGGSPLSGGALSGGLKDLLDRFTQTGHEAQAQSWVSKGPNQPIAPPELEHALGEERIAWLMEETHMSREDLLRGLSGELPGAIDKLTPEGRLPTGDELSRNS